MLSVALMGHPSRRAFMAELEPQLPGVEVVLDRRNDRWDTGRRALLAHDPVATHHLVVQDDAILCRDFLAAAARLAEVAGDRPVSLYTGKVRPHQLTVTRAVRKALKVGAPWVAGIGPYWGVALIVPAAHIPAIVEWGDRATRIQNYDRRVEGWYTEQKIDCWYTVPSLADHRPVDENPSLIAGRTGNRQAHLFAGEKSALGIDWSRPPVYIPGRRSEVSPSRARAARDCYGYDSTGIRRKVRAGRPIPPGITVDPDDLVQPDAPSPAATVEPVPPTPAVADGAPVESWSPDQSAAALRALVESRQAAGREIVVRGTGSNGNVVKADLVAALRADDEAG